MPAVYKKAYSVRNWKKNAPIKNIILDFIVPPSNLFERVSVNAAIETGSISPSGYPMSKNNLIGFDKLKPISFKNIA